MTDSGNVLRRNNIALAAGAFAASGAGGDAGGATAAGGASAPFVVAIDGPSGAGKSSAARHVAEALGIDWVDTGAMYRAAGLAALRAGADLADEDAVARAVEAAVIEAKPSPSGQVTLLDGEDVSKAIRSPEASAASSAVAKVPAVRARLQALQRGIAATTDVIMDGRDIASRVMPDAPVKVFLTATPETRAQRRYEELLNKRLPVVYEDVLADVKARDRQDETRAADPLRPAPGAVVLATDGMSLQEVADWIADRVRGLGIRSHRDT